VDHAGCILVRFLKRGVVLNRGRIKDDHIGEAAGLESAATIQP
jgi:hypothetical protein